MSRDTRAAILASVVVVAVVVLGFSVLGGPGTQRLVRSDERTVQTLAQLAQNIQVKYRGANDQLPANLDTFSNKEKQDPLSHKAFVYRPHSKNAYELCANFLSDNRHEVPGEPENGWRHPKGDFCFQLDATKPVSQAPFDY
jgi:hypothetical protein